MRPASRAGRCLAFSTLVLLTATLACQEPASDETPVGEALSEEMRADLGLVRNPEAALEERVDAIRRLAEVNNTGAIPALQEAARGAGTELQEEILDALETIGGDDAIAASGEILAAATNSEVQLRAIEALDFLGGEEAAAQIARVLGAADPDVRLAAAEALGFMDVDELIPQLREAYAREQSAEVRDALAYALDGEVEEELPEPGPSEAAPAEGSP